MSDSQSRAARPRSRTVSTIGGVLLVLGLSACGLGEDEDDFPSSQIEVIVPWSAGGGTDLSVRQLVEAAEETCEVDMVVSNQEGGGGATGHQAMADAEPDGYTVGAATIEVSILNHLDAADVTPEDLQGVMQYSANPAVLSVADDSEFESVHAMLDAMEAGEEVRVGTNGTGGIWDIAAGGLAQEIGIEFTERVPYDGGADMIAALLGGEVEAIAPNAGESMDQFEAGEMRPLVAMSEERLDILPDTPTLEEEGIDWSTANWFGLVVPDGTEAERVEALSDCFGEAYETEEFQEYMESQGFGLEHQAHEEFEAFMDDEFESYGELADELYN